MESPGEHWELQRRVWRKRSTTWARREVFQKPLASYQLVQDKLAGMLTQLGGNQPGQRFRLAELKDAGEVSGEQISLAKYANVQMAQETARTSRELLGGVGILDTLLCVSTHGESGIGGDLRRHTRYPSPCSWAAGSRASKRFA